MIYYKIPIPLIGNLSLGRVILMQVEYSQEFQKQTRRIRNFGKELYKIFNNHL